MDQTVALLVAAVCLFGTALGLRFSVYVLIPAGLAVLIVSAMAQLIWKKMAGWGVPGTLGLLMLLNAGFALGLFLRAGAAFWSTKRIARLFARPGDLDQPDPSARWRRTRGEQRRNAGRRLQLRPATWQKRVSVDNADQPCRAAYSRQIPRRPAAFLPTIQAMLLRVAYDLVGSGMPLSARMAPSIRFNLEMCRSRSSKRFSALLISASLSASPAVLSGSRVSCS